jgi:hypothetical protein
MSTVILQAKTQQASRPIPKLLKDSQQIIPKRAVKENTATASELWRSLTLEDLVPRLGTSKNMVRIFLRKNYPEAYVKNKSWRISHEFAKQIEMDYKNQVKIRDAKKKLRIDKELSGYA